MANLKNQSVHAGHTITLKVAGSPIGRAQSIEATRNFGTEGQYEIGSIMPQEHIPLKYEGTITFEKYLVRKKSLAALGLASLGVGILNVDVIDIEITDKYTGDIVVVYRSCTLISQSEDYRVGAIAGEHATWGFLSSDNGTPETIDTAAASTVNS
jgi:hypothetical protein